MEIKKPETICLEFVYACMGFGNSEPDVGSMALIEKCKKLVLDAATPAAVYQSFDLGALNEIQDSGTGKVHRYVGNKKFRLKGNAIAHYLEDCEQCILMAVTLGVQVDKLIRKTQLTNMVEAVAMDACASSLTEDICDEINGKLEAEFAEQGKGILPRFSPGYGDLPLETQDIFDQLLDMNKKIGLTQSKEHLLIPRKSVTAIMGVLPIEELKKKNENKNRKEKAVGNADISNEACAVCQRKNNCSFRKNGGFCGRIRTE